MRSRSGDIILRLDDENDRSGYTSALATPAADKSQVIAR